MIGEEKYEKARRTYDMNGQKPTWAAEEIARCTRYTYDEAMARIRDAVIDAIAAMYSAKWEPDSATAPCPHCSGEADVFEEIPGGYIVQCRDCCASIGIMPYERAVMSWNRRA
jgi:hypothetical protein